MSLNSELTKAFEEIATRFLTLENFILEMIKINNTRFEKIVEETLTLDDLSNKRITELEKIIETLEKRIVDLEYH